jgi:hypothetical protein
LPLAVLTSVIACETLLRMAERSCAVRAEEAAGAVTGGVTGTESWRDTASGAVAMAVIAPRVVSRFIMGMASFDHGFELNGLNLT